MSVPLQPSSPAHVSCESLNSPRVSPAAWPVAPSPKSLEEPRWARHLLPCLHIAQPAMDIKIQYANYENMVNGKKTFENMNIHEFAVEVHRLTMKKLCYSNKRSFALNSSFSDADYICVFSDTLTLDSNLGH